MEKNISTIIFDFGNVLIDLDIPRFYNNFRELMGLPRDNNLEEERKFHEVMASYEHGFISSELFINSIIKMSHNSVQALDVISQWNSMLVGIKPETLNFLKDLKKNYNTYILSNTNALHLDWVHKHLKKDHGVEDFENEYLHGAFYSHNMKMAKPEPEIYRSVQLEIDVRPEEILFIDDREENIVGAQEAGWMARIHEPRTPVEYTLRSVVSLPN